MTASNKSQETRYVIITPVRDEAKHIEDTIRSVLAQTIAPAEWVIVDDGSTDSTGAIIDRYAAQYAWISAVHRLDRGFRRPATGVMEAFEEGFCGLKTVQWDFVVKLDGDLKFEADYFEKCFVEFQRDPRLGIGGGNVVQVEKGTVGSDPSGPPFHVRGATKIYRRACWEAIGGLIKAPGWDTVDELKANMLGWRTRTFAKVEIEQQRITGAADGMWQNAVKDGRADYVSGYHPVFMLFKCLKRTVDKPFLLRAAGLLCGYAGGYLTGAPRVTDEQLIRYVRRQQLRRLLLRESIWK